MNYLVYNPSNIKRQALNSLKLPIIAPFPYFMDFEDFNLQIKINTNLVFPHFEYNNFRNHLSLYESVAPTALPAAFGHRK